MAFYRIETTPGESDQRQSVTLDGVVFGLRFRWNARGAVWILEVRDAAGAALALGVVVRVGHPLLTPRGNRPGLPAGDFMAVDTSGAYRDPTLDDFGTRVEIQYADASELGRG